MLADFVYDNIDKIIKRNRDRLMRFSLKNDNNFKKFLNTAYPIQEGIIGDAKNEIFELFEKTIEKDVALANISESLKLILNKAYQKDENSLRTKLKNLYQP